MYFKIISCQEVIKLISFYERIRVLTLIMLTQYAAASCMQPRIYVSYSNQDDRFCVKLNLYSIEVRYLKISLAC